jgi:hypothetical protein
MCFIEDFLNKIESEEWQRYNTAVEAMKQTPKPKPVEHKRETILEVMVETGMTARCTDGVFRELKCGSRIKVPEDPNKDLGNETMYLCKLIDIDGVPEFEVAGEYLKFYISEGALQQIK